ncbi:LysR substrate-binding domain-containing protein [Sphingopyxis terrae]|uniref:LysR substrate-binding domain-containing protein n=1 Tax=Sphingopyxis terrae TaxID=33052 RepID=UPI002A13EB4E|nr:LysR substrate-binding domain-containing protein [Sphingopyxis terrae]MDX8356423.1 LysR substrate-binding domain-containing protein [Sphingopyxis terrae]
MKPLPSLTSLRLLALIAKHGSLSDAASHGGMTQSAVSRRLAALENILGVTLLQRHRRGAELTAAGADYLAAIGPALKSIEAATIELGLKERAAPLRIRVYTTFAARWLMPRLHEFQSAHPEIDVMLDTTVGPAGLSDGNVDVAIQYGDGDWGDVNAALLMEDRIEAVCSPMYAARHGEALRRGALGGLQLLQSRYLKSDWRDWADGAGVAIDNARLMTFSSSLLAYQAAVDGMGIAIGQVSLLRAELDSGALLAPFEKPLTRAAGFYLITARGLEPRRVSVFRRWIEREALSASSSEVERRPPAKLSAP